MLRKREGSALSLLCHSFRGEYCGGSKMTLIKLSALPLSNICYYYMYESYCKHTADLLYASVNIHVYYKYLCKDISGARQLLVPLPKNSKFQINELYFKPGNKTDLVMIIMINIGRLV